MSDPDLRVLRTQLERVIGNDPALVRAFERLFARVDAMSTPFSGNHSDLTLDDGTNPHGTTKSDVGLSAVANLLQLGKTEAASTSNGEGASLIGVEDSAGNFTGVNVEAVLAELFPEYGSNSDGHYVVFPGGLQLCWYQESSTVTTSQATGNVYRDPSGISITFPKAFGAAPFVLPIADGGNSPSVWGGGPASVTTTGCSLRVLSAGVGLTAKAGYVAIGFA